ncbi:XopAU family type III secretion system effector serine/threonine kinase [Acidovorax sp. BLS4]|uniref:XopAU family type III secretion system effector serine/threonine kinase n=1 Tax=Acidovorax sp. BLS4 TaxID=3273430 RepID=UPI0029437B9E|nr:XopAU family type III secretion system effector serine/threonine kinase [Paracidovorax avenae]WOI45082.1 XopAU family type III secretion system effector serine/threonine kinase [Paracidovorax avenae]
MISHPLSASPQRSVAENRESASQATPPPANPGTPAPGASHPSLLLERRRRTLGERASEGLRFNAQLPALGDRMAGWFSPRSLPGVGSPLSTPRSSPGARAFSSPPSILTALLDPPTPVARHRASDSWNAALALGQERRLQSVMRSTSPGVVLSPRLVRKLSQQCSAPDLVERLAAMKPGAADIGNGFTAVALEPSGDGTSHAAQGLRRLGAGAAGTAYAVRLSENFWRDGRDCGRDFVFKAMLSTDPANPASRTLYDTLEEGADPTDAIAQEKAKIHKEYQVAVALGNTAQVMRVYGLVQIGSLFGILAEKIEGPKVSQVIDLSRQALNQGDIKPLEYLALAWEMVADVLIGASRFADEGVVHQDISHNNVLYDERQKMFRLIDMGLGVEKGEPLRMGTWGYVEMRASASHHKRDVYSVAQLLVHFLKSPDFPMGLVGISSASSVETFPFMDALKALPPDSKADVVQLLNRMIARDPDERASAQELLQDPLFGEMPPRDDVHAIYQRLSGPLSPVLLPVADREGTSSQRTVSASMASRSSCDSVPAAWRSLSVPSSTL